MGKAHRKTRDRWIDRRELRINYGLAKFLYDRNQDKEDYGRKGNGSGI